MLIFIQNVFLWINF